jgi:DNA-binding transcriptional regulator LsrR (DeoR family)
MTEKELSDSQQMELLSVVSHLFCKGINRPAAVHTQIKDHFPQPVAELFQPENYWNMIRLAAEWGLFEHRATTGSPVEHRLLHKTPWLTGRLTIVQTAALEVVASVAARRLVELIRAEVSRTHNGTVHVGFAGGRTLRLIAEQLAPLLREPHRDNPSTLVFHAMVAGFDTDDFQLDPNSFINCLLSPDSPVDIRLVRLPMPGIVSSDEYEQLRKLPSIARVLESARDIQIVVTSGSLLHDQSSTISAFMEHLSQSASAGAVDQLLAVYKEAEVVGDLLWQPVTRHGPLQMPTPYRVATLMPLQNLQDFIRTASERRVLLVLGRSGISGTPKSELLQALLQQPNPLFTDLVVDTPTVHGCFEPAILEQYTRARPHRPK